MSVYSFHSPQSDLDILENLKDLIKNGQHEFYRAVPQPAALANVFLGPVTNALTSPAEPSSEERIPESEHLMSSISLERETDRFYDRDRDNTARDRDWQPYDRRRPSYDRFPPASRPSTDSSYYNRRPPYDDYDRRRAISPGRDSAAIRLEERLSRPAPQPPTGPSLQERISPSTALGAPKSTVPARQPSLEERLSAPGPSVSATVPATTPTAVGPASTSLASTSTATTPTTAVTGPATATGATSTSTPAPVTVKTEEERTPRLHNADTHHTPASAPAAFPRYRSGDDYRYRQPPPRPPGAPYSRPYSPLPPSSSAALPVRSSVYTPRDPRDVRDSRDSRDIRDSRDARDPRDTRDPRDLRDLRDARDTKDYTRDSRDLPRDIRDTRDQRDSRDMRDTRDIRDRDPRDHKWSNDGKTSLPPSSGPSESATGVYNRSGPPPAAITPSLSRERDYRPPPVPSLDLSRERERERERERAALDRSLDKMNLERTLDRPPPVDSRDRMNVDRSLDRIDRMDRTDRLDRPLDRSIDRMDRSLDRVDHMDRSLDRIPRDISRERSDTRAPPVYNDRQHPYSYHHGPPHPHDRDRMDVDPPPSSSSTVGYIPPDRPGSYRRYPSPPPPPSLPSSAAITPISSATRPGDRDRDRDRDRIYPAPGVSPPPRSSAAAPGVDAPPYGDRGRYPPGPSAGPGSAPPLPQSPSSARDPRDREWHYPPPPPSYDMRRRDWNGEDEYWKTRNLHWEREREMRDPRDARDGRDARDLRDVRERDVRDMRDLRDSRDVRDPRSLSGYNPPPAVLTPAAPPLSPRDRGARDPADPRDRVVLDRGGDRDLDTRGRYDRDRDRPNDRDRDRERERERDMPPPPPPPRGPGWETREERERREGAYQHHPAHPSSSKPSPPLPPSGPAANAGIPPPPPPSATRQSTSGLGAHAGSTPAATTPAAGVAAGTTRGGVPVPLSSRISDPYSPADRDRGESRPYDRGQQYSPPPPGGYTNTRIRPRSPSSYPHLERGPGMEPPVKRSRDDTYLGGGYRHYYDRDRDRDRWVDPRDRSGRYGGPPYIRDPRDVRDPRDMRGGDRYIPAPLHPHPSNSAGPPSSTAATPTTSIAPEKAPSKSAQTTPSAAVTTSSPGIPLSPQVQKQGPAASSSSPTKES